MKPDKRITQQREACKELHTQGLQHTYTSEEARAAARKRWDKYYAKKARAEAKEAARLSGLEHTDTIEENNTNILDNIKVGGTD